MKDNTLVKMSFLERNFHCDGGRRRRGRRSDSDNDIDIEIDDNIPEYMQNAIK